VGCEDLPGQAQRLSEAIPFGLSAGLMKSRKDLPGQGKKKTGVGDFVAFVYNPISPQS
jgi:hypothetical protein